MKGFEVLAFKEVVKELTQVKLMNQTLWKFDGIRFKETKFVHWQDNVMLSFALKVEKFGW